MRHLKRLARVFSPLMLLLTLTTSPASAGPLEEGTNAYEQGDYSTALRLLLPLAENGQKEAQATIGFMYLTGRGVPQDNLEGSKWFRKAADQGHLLAQSNLGLMYLFGQGVPQDSQTAMKYLQKSADQGDGLGQFGLGIMYLGGKGVAQDPVKALMWFTLAANSEPAGSNVSARYRDKLSAPMTPEQISEAQRLAREWKPQKEK